MFPAHIHVYCHPFLVPQVYEPVDFLHLYNRDSLDLSNVYVATGDSGQGITGGTIAGIVITDCIMGNKNPMIPVFDTKRRPPLATAVAASQSLVVAHTAEVGNSCDRLCFRRGMSRVKKEEVN